MTTTTISTPERVARVRLAVNKAFAGLSDDAREDMADAVLRAVQAQVALALRDKPAEPDDHPTTQAYDAGFAHGKRAAQGRYGRGDVIEAAAKSRAKSYEDSEAYMDGFWNAVHRRA